MLLLACKTLQNPCPLLDQIWVAASEVSNPADFGITTETIYQVFAWGFGVVLLAFLFGYGIGVARAAIRQI